MTPSDDETEGLGAAPGEIAGTLLIDVRRAPAFGPSRYVLPGASWRDPQEIQAWAHTLDASCDIVVYCVHGHEVSRNAARQLVAFGLRARFLRGGFEAWKDAGLPLDEKPEPSSCDN